MSYEEVEHVDYQDEIWTLQNQKPHTALADFLTAKDHLIVLRHGEPPYKVILGVPHQAAVGEDYICERRFENGKQATHASDENAASYALVAFTTLRDHDIPCKLVIIAHATTHNPNKKPGSPYWQEIFADTDGAPILFECHGAAPRRHLPLELSAGKNRLSDTVRFGQSLVETLEYCYPLGVQKAVGGDSACIFGTDDNKEKGKLENPALETKSLVEAESRGMPALHLEAKPAFRKPADGSNTVTPDGLVLGRAIARAIIQYLSEHTDG